MRNIDFSPLFRTAIGFDRMASMLDSASRASAENGWPPYDIELVSEDRYRITMAVAGFKGEELDVEVKENTLTVIGRKEDKPEERNYLHRGIAFRNFERKFQLADHVQVTGADLSDGLLHVELKREIPEAMKPRKIAIGGTSRLIEADSKAA